MEIEIERQVVVCLCIRTPFPLSCVWLFLKKKKKEAMREREREIERGDEHTRKEVEREGWWNGERMRQTVNSASIPPSLRLIPTKILILTTFESPIYTENPKRPTLDKSFLLLCLFLCVEVVFSVSLNSQTSKP